MSNPHSDLDANVVFHVHDVTKVYTMGEDVLQIPASALFRHSDGWVMFRVEGSRARLQPIEVGHNNGFAAEIVNGPSVVDRVIVHPSDVIKDSMRIAPRQPINHAEILEDGVCIDGDALRSISNTVCSRAYSEQTHGVVAVPRGAGCRVGSS